MDDTFSQLNSWIESSAKEENGQRAELRRAEREREKSAAYYATLRRELQHVACSTKQQRLAAKTRSKDSAAETWLLYLHEVHQFKSEIKHNRILKQTKTSTQSCRKRRDSERAEDAIAALGPKGSMRSGVVFIAFVCLRMKNIQKNIVETFLNAIFPFFHFPLFDLPSANWGRAAESAGWAAGGYCIGIRNNITFQFV